MITRFQVQNYKALRDIALDLTPIHVLIGPNNSGKSSLLGAVAAYCRSASMNLADAFEGRWNGPELAWNQDATLPVGFTVRFAEGHRHTFRCRFTASGRRIQSVFAESMIGPDKVKHDFSDNDRRHSEVFPAANGSIGGRFRDLIGSCAAYRWEPHQLALPVAFSHGGRYWLHSNGFGLAMFLDEMVNGDRERFDQMEASFRSLFPEVARIRLIHGPAFKHSESPEWFTPAYQPDLGKGIGIELQSGAVVPAQQMSDGMLFVLAYLAVLHQPNPPRTILIEEPENGIHPARLKDIVGYLRELINGQQQSQVILTTHSPYLVDMFQPTEVTLCRKQEDGSITVRRLSESRRVREQMDLFMLGEIWTASGDEGLFDADDRQEAA